MRFPASVSKHLGSFSCAVLALCSAGAFAAPPYPASTIVTGVTWVFPATNGLTRAYGSDIWPVTWASDGNQYSIWGDGGGFDGAGTAGNPEANQGKVSLGIARLTGKPVSGVTASYAGKNVFGSTSPSCPPGTAPCAESAANIGGKSVSIISIGGTLYATGAIITSSNCMAPCRGGPTQQFGDPALLGGQGKLIYSTNLGHTWTVSSWSSSSVGDFINFGRDNAGALDSNAYLTYQCPSSNTKICLKRVATSNITSDPATSGNYQYLTAVDGSGNPSWSTSASAAQPMFADANHIVTPFHVAYDFGIGRFIATVGHDPAGDFSTASAGKLGVFESANPWGPWRTVAYYEPPATDWGGFDAATLGDYLGLFIAPAWISADGRNLWMQFAGHHTGSGPNMDSFNLARATFTVSSGIPVFVSPAPGTVLAPGQTVTATASGSSLSWSIDRIGDGLPAFATGSGSSITFTVPSNATSSQKIRATVTGSAGSVYLDYPISATAAGLHGYWQFAAGSGSTAVDTSGYTNTGTLVNSPSWVTGHVGDDKALSFNGTNSYVSVPARASLANLPSGGLTVSAWIKPAGAGGGGKGRIVDKDNNDVGWYFAMNSANSLVFGGDKFPTASAQRISTGAVTLNTWQSVVATWDGTTNAGNIHIYVNGVNVDSTATNGSGSPVLDDSGTPFEIGNRQSDAARGFSGAIHNVRVYKRVLSASEIQTLAASGG